MSESEEEIQMRAVHITNDVREGVWRSYHAWILPPWLNLVECSMDPRCLEVDWNPQAVQDKIS